MTLDDPPFSFFVPKDDLEGLGHKIFGILQIRRRHCASVPLTTHFPSDVRVLKETTETVEGKDSADHVLVVEVSADFDVAAVAHLFDDLALNDRVDEIHHRALAHHGFLQVWLELVLAGVQGCPDLHEIGLALPLVLVGHAIPVPVLLERHPAAVQHGSQ